MQKGFLGTGHLVTRKTRTPPHPCPSRRPQFPHRTRLLTWPHAVAVEKGEGSGQPSASFLTVEQHGPASTDDDGHGHIVHGKVQPMGPPAGDGEDEVAITKVITVTTTVVQIENHRKRGRSPEVKVKTKSNTETRTEEEVVVGPITDSDGD